MSNFSVQRIIWTIKHNYQTVEEIEIAYEDEYNLTLKLTPKRTIHAYRHNILAIVKEITSNSEAHLYFDQDHEYTLFIRKPILRQKRLAF